MLFLGILFILSPSRNAFAMSTEVNVDDPPRDPRGQGDDEKLDPLYWEAIQRTAGMVWDDNVLRLAAGYGMEVLNVTWEDTGRYYNSAVGPNISDVTIQVEHINPDTGQYELTLMPVIRFPNFTDLTADIPIDDFYLLVGNERGNGLERISLENYLDNFRRFLHDPDSWAGREKSLLAPRDSHVLVSAQAAFLPIPQEGKATFNPVIFNYQSYQGDPAVLTIVATREGTSATIIDNMRDAFPAGYSWGQRLFFNQNGERASFTGERLSDFVDENRSTFVDGPEAAGESGLNMVLLIQVPLKQEYPFEETLGVYESAPSAEKEMAGADVEAAVVGHGPVEGPFTEIDDIEIERDERFPIRVTVQFYIATSNGVVTEGDMAEIAAQIERVYEDADYVGSLVVDGLSERPTEYDGPKEEPEGWWEAFWKRFEDNTGITRWNAREILNELQMVAWRMWEDLTR
jgi:hypothetical protein